MRNREVLLWWSAFCACLFLISIYLMLSKPGALRTFVTGEKEVDWVKVPLEEAIRGTCLAVRADDPRVIKYVVRNGYVQPPFPFQRHVLKTPKDKDPSMGQSQLIRQIFKDERDGFFVEAGALDGETRSNTLWLERNLHWTGLLIEADPSNYARLVRRRRNAWTSRACLSPKPQPHEAEFKENFNLGRVTNLNVRDRGSSEEELLSVHCFPLISLLMAIGHKTVDYFSLDVEGLELDVLEGIPWDKIFIKTLSVEFKHIRRGKMALKEFMEGKGYVVVAEVTHPQDLANDFIFVHSSLTELLQNAWAAVNKDKYFITEGSNKNIIKKKKKFRKMKSKVGT